MHDSSARGTFDGRGAVVGGVGVAAGEPVDVAGEADQVAGDDRPDAEQLGERRPRRGDRHSDAPVRCLELLVEALHIDEQLGGLVPAGGRDGTGRFDAVEEGDGVRSVEFLGDPPGGEFHQQVVETANDPGAVVADVHVALGQ
jgi:hypothetical protein